jgi:hypothetical protein
MSKIKGTDIHRAAFVLIEEHGDDALIVAAAKVDEMLGKGDLEGRAIWMAVLRAIDELATVEVPISGLKH